MNAISIFDAFWYISSLRMALDLQPRMESLILTTDGLMVKLLTSTILHLVNRKFKMYHSVLN